MTAAAYRQVIAAPPRDRLDLFLETANRLSAPVGNVEKNFWVCWILNALYRERLAGRPRLLFEGGTSLAEAYGLIRRFSADIDITVFRDDLDEPASVEEPAVLSKRKRRDGLDAIRDACKAYITDPLREFLAAQLTDAASGAGRVAIGVADADGQALLVWYPEVELRNDTYVQPSVRIEPGAKSALDRRGDCHRRRPHLLGQGGTRAWPASLARVAQRSPTGRTACVAALLRPALSARFARWQGGARGSGAWRRLCPARSHVLRSPRLRSCVGRAKHLRNRAD